MSELCAACDYTDNGYCTCECHSSDTSAYTLSGIFTFIDGNTARWGKP